MYKNKNNNYILLFQNYNKTNVRFNLHMINFNCNINSYQKQINKLSNQIRISYKVLSYKIMIESNKLPIFILTRYRHLKIKLIMKKIT